MQKFQTVNSADIQIRTGDLPLTKRVLYPTELCQLLRDPILNLGIHIGVLAFFRKRFAVSCLPSPCWRASFVLEFSTACV